MARFNVNGGLGEGRMLLNVVSSLQRARAELGRVCDVMDATRNGADFTALGAALGVNGAGTGSDAEVIYSQFTSLKADMNAQIFVDLAKIDQG